MTEDRIYSLAEWLAIPPRPRKVRTFPDGIELLQGRGYFIDWARIDTGTKLIHWVRHLITKKWVDKETIEDLIDAVDRKFDLHIVHGPRSVR